MNKIKLVLLIIILLFTEFSFGQVDYKINGQIRPRFQYNNNDFNSNTGINTFSELRSRLGVKFNPSKNLTGFIQLQDSRIFGSEPSTLSKTVNIDLHQAYFSINKLFLLPLNLKIGRMELSYGSERLIGAVGWSNVGRSFDGSLLKLNTESLDIDFILARTGESGLQEDSLDMFFYSAYGNINGIDNFKIQPFVIGEYRSKTDFNRYTLGLFMSSKQKGKGFYHELEAAYQLGTQNSIQDISAYMLTYNFSYTFESDNSPMLGAGIDFLSGDDRKDISKYKVFNTLYATNHKFYGYMDYFINIPANTFGLGLIDIQGKAAINTSDNFNLATAFHLFKSHQDYNLFLGGTSKSFGSEVDLTLSYKYSKEVKFVGGFSIFTPGDIFKEKRGTDTSTWGYLMAIVNL